MKPTTPFINPKYAPKPLTQNIALDMVDLEAIERAVRNKLECDRKRKEKLPDGWEEQKTVIAKIQDGANIKGYRILHGKEREEAERIIKEHQKANP